MSTGHGGSMQPEGGIHYGGGAVPPEAGRATGRLVRAFGDDCYVVENPEALRPFLTTLVSDSDLWLFVTSNGGITAGRRSPATALFPYVTEDRLADSPGVTGPVTSVLCTRAGRTALWRPLADGDRLVYRLRRRLYRSALGTRLVFEEENDDLGLCFRASWRASHRYGFVRECALANRGAGPVAIRLVDGLVNLLPGDADEWVQANTSSLLDAYKQCERLPGSPLAVYTLAAQVVDRPEPREALHATTVWSHGLPGARIRLTASARERFERGGAVPDADTARGHRGAYLAEADLELPAGASREWWVVADVQRTQRDVSGLLVALERPEALVEDVRADLARAAARVEAIVAATDGQQLGEDRNATAHHLSNVLFNDLRGGIYAHGAQVPGRDFEAFVRGANRPVAARHAAFLAALPELEPCRDHRARVEAAGDPDLTRLSAEYLPLSFSRRHGDPSRPWNRFEIRVRDARGEPVLDYQGNWRDIFQNWEALSRSFPAFAEQLVAKFVNASTADGHNPYRIGRDGIGWEVPDPGHPWSTIGYWGDHQIVYLLRLLELSTQHAPGALRAWLERPMFTYADVPYELRPWADVVANPKDTIRFDAAKHARVEARARELGSDGRLLHDGGGIVRVTLVEKLLVPALAKLANLVPGGGIWMNTQRPEWNDANNALVGYGVSMVTLCHLERYLRTVAALLRPLAGRRTPLSREVARWVEGTLESLRDPAALEEPVTSDESRGRLMEALGTVASRYRATVYRSGFSGREAVPVDHLLELLARAGAHARHSLAQGRRDDALFHAYSVLVPRPGRRAFGLERLEVMLEGQVAALGTEALDDAAACALLDALRRSPLYREDQRSYLLYPDRRLPGFLEKNVVPEAALESAPALARLLAAGEERIVLRDAAGRLRFHPALVNGDACARALAAVRADGAIALRDGDVAAVLEAYEAVFRHRAFTGRSGTMFAYEGLGSIYWHMVGKLLLAVQERFVEAAERGAPPAVLARLAAHFHAIRAGMGGAEKSPAEWGAFPLDAYSHTPEDGGARQPGMTGQVKEEILIRLGELGVLVREGRIAFRPRLLRRSELLAEPAGFEPRGVDGRRVRIPLEPGCLAFTLCQVPVVYHLAAEPRLAVTWSDGTSGALAGDTLDAETSAAIFARDGRVARVDVWTTPGA